VKFEQGIAIIMQHHVRALRWVLYYLLLFLTTWRITYILIMKSIYKIIFYRLSKILNRNLFQMF
jgi:hypothetical protein